MSIFGAAFEAEPTEVPEACSAKGCQRDATWQLLWNNPKIHTEDRRKIWLACAEHKVTLGDFLTARGFLRQTLPHPQ